jgi:hypothetical protein
MMNGTTLAAVWGVQLPTNSTYSASGRVHRSI